MKLILFDCDDTIWEAPQNDYISRLDSSYILEDGIVVREADGSKYLLKHDAVKLMQSSYQNGCIIGIISDNNPSPVLEALDLFGLTKYLTSSAINIRLWDGYCPKHLMVQEILAKPFASGIKPNEVLWLDDKDYTKEASEIGVNFYRVTKSEPINPKLK